MAQTTKTTTATKKKAAKAPGKETNLVRRVTMKARAVALPDFSSGDTVNVFVKVKEGEKERTQIYKGVVTKLQGSGSARSFTVRKISAGVGVERTFPMTSPAVEKVEVLNKGQVRRAKLYYLRGLEGKAAKIQSELVVTAETTATAE